MGYLVLVSPQKRVLFLSDLFGCAAIGSTRNLPPLLPVSSLGSLALPSAAVNYMVVQDRTLTR